MEATSTRSTATGEWDARQVAGLVLLFGQLAWTLLAPEAPWLNWSEPTHIAVAAVWIVTPALGLLRFLPPRRLRLERAILALFLAGMPVVYLWAALLRAPDAGTLWMEGLGGLIFGGLAGLGYWRYPWVLGLGVVGHGLGWDLWHYGRSHFIPDWYSLGCLITDVGVGLYALTQAKAYGSPDHAKGIGR
jgi:hypothetical protein